MTQHSPPKHSNSARDKRKVGSDELDSSRMQAIDRVLSPPMSLSSESGSDDSDSRHYTVNCSMHIGSMISSTATTDGFCDDAGNTSDMSDDENEIPPCLEDVRMPQRKRKRQGEATNHPRRTLTKSGEAIMKDLSKREAQPAPYFGYVDHSLDEDPDPLSPLSPPLRTPSFPAKVRINFRVFKSFLCASILDCSIT